MANRAAKDDDPCAAHDRGKAEQDHPFRTTCGCARIANRHPDANAHVCQNVIAPEGTREERAALPQRRFRVVELMSALVLHNGPTFNGRPGADHVRILPGMPRASRRNKTGRSRRVIFWRWSSRPSFFL